MGKQILQKYTIFELKLYLAEMEKQYGKDRVAELIGGEERSAEIDREFKKAVAERLEPYWKDIQAYEHGGFWARLRVELKYTFRDRSAECDVPKHVLQAIVDDMLPRHPRKMCAFFGGFALTSNVFGYPNTAACLVSRLLGSTLIPRRNGDIYGKTDITKIHNI